MSSLDWLHAFVVEHPLFCILVCFLLLLVFGFFDDDRMVL